MREFIDILEEFEAIVGDEYKNSWKRGETAYFEYHCWRDHTSGDAQIWYRSHQPVVVLGVKDKGYGRTIAYRMENGSQKVYRVKFPDGLEWDVFEDELYTSAEHYDPKMGPPSKEEIAKQSA